MYLFTPGKTLDFGTCCALQMKSVDFRGPTKVLSGTEALDSCPQESKGNSHLRSGKGREAWGVHSYHQWWVWLLQNLTGIIRAQVLKFLHPGNNLWGFYGKSGFNSVDPQSHGAVRAADFYRST